MTALRQSEMKTWRACPRAYYLRHVCRIRPVNDTEALRFGSLMHRLLEQWWRAAALEPLSPDGWICAAMAQLGSESTIDPVAGARARALMAGYHCCWTRDGEHTYEGKRIRVLGAEVPFFGPMLDPDTGNPVEGWQISGTLDAVCEIDGQIYGVEHKTSSEDVTPGSTYWERLRMDIQVGHYYAGLRALGYECGGILYDVIVKPRQAPLLATPAERRRYRADGTLYAAQRGDDETIDDYTLRLIDEISARPEMYYRRAVVVRFDREEREAMRDARDAAGEIEDARRAHRWPRNPGSCRMYGARCEYWPACAGEASIDDPRLFTRD